MTCVYGVILMYILHVMPLSTFSTLYVVDTSGLESRDMLMVKCQVTLPECIAS